jgi:hypothetical protein
MDTIIYSSYEEIDQNLAILKLEREIHYQKASLHLQRAKDSLSPNNLVADIAHSFVEGYTGWTGSILGFIVVMIFRRFFSGK